MTAGATALLDAIHKRGLTLERAGWLLEVDHATIYRWTTGRQVPNHLSTVDNEDEFGVGHRLWLKSASTPKTPSA